MRIKRDDTVKVIAGNASGQTGRVLTADAKSGKVVVEGVNQVYKHVRRSQKNPQGGRLRREMPIQVSNVMLVCTACGKATRVGLRLTGDGAKERYCRKCGTSQGEISPPKNQ